MPGDDLRVAFFAVPFFLDAPLDFLELAFTALPVELFFVVFFVAIFYPFYVSA